MHSTSTPLALNDSMIFIFVKETVKEIFEYFENLLAIIWLQLKVIFQYFSMSFSDFISSFISGTIGGAGLVAVRQPFDTIKTKMQTFPELYKKMGPLKAGFGVYQV